MAAIDTAHGASASEEQISSQQGDPSRSHDADHPRVAGDAARGRPGALRRYPDRGMLGGVCAGLAESVGRDPLVVRIVAAASVAAAGVGVLAYLIAWTLIPAATPANERTSRSPADWVKAALLVVGVLGVLGSSRKLLLSQATLQFSPIELTHGHGGQVVSMATGTALVVLAVWLIVFLAIGAWRTRTMDA